MKKNIKHLFVFLIIINLSFSFNDVYAAGSVDAGGDDKTKLYQAGKKLVYRAKKLEKKNKKEKAEKLYLKALIKFEKAYAGDKKNADILNYLGYTLRKTGNFEKAEFFYLKGLELDAGHLGINEYLGELYVQTNRIELAKKRLEVLNGCKCEEYEELKELIEKN
jgi:Flp pilus assembly protein TadD